MKSSTISIRFAGVGPLGDYYEASVTVDGAERFCAMGILSHAEAWRAAGDFYDGLVRAETVAAVPVDPQPVEVRAAAVEAWRDEATEPLRRRN